MAHSPCDYTLWIKYDGTAIVGGSDATPPSKNEQISYNGYYYKRQSTTQYCNLYTKKPHNHTSGGDDYHLTAEDGTSNYIIESRTDTVINPSNSSDISGGSGVPSPGSGDDLTTK